ncbi:MAG: SIMPL domain-containing protein [Alphaproteobacteria bacterium]|nr:SIMPL domain-containing protein [Alphaproteobacteria bacterium]
MTRIAAKFAIIPTVLLTAVLLVAGPARADVGKIPSVTVTGSGAATATPDTADVRVGATVFADTATKALADAGTRAEGLLKAARSQGIADRDIQTSGVSLRPRMTPGNRNRQNQPGQKPGIAGYVARLDYTLIIRDLEKLGTILDRLVAAGGNEMGAIRMFVSETGALTDAARQNAMKDAEHAAAILAGEAGLRLGPVLRIEESTASPGPVRMMSARAEGVPMPTGEISYRMRVQVTYALETKKKPKTGR